MCDIVKIPSKNLKEVSKQIEKEKILNKNYINDLKKELSCSLDSTKYGVAIAAPQIGKNIRAFLVSGNVLSTINNKEKCEHKLYINPKITSHSKEKVARKEGCLSVPNRYGEVERYKKVTIKYIDENGNKKTEKATGFLAQIFQHEIDHLDGVLFIDKAEKLYEVDEDFNIIKRIK